MSARAHAATACFWLTIAVILVTDLRLVVTHVVTVCGGLDSAGYVGSARLLLSGHLMQYEPIARVLPFPNATAAAAPLGFVAAGQPYFISPRFPPGLPLLMAVICGASATSCAFRSSTSRTTGKKSRSLPAAWSRSRTAACWRSASITNRWPFDASF
jgi:hypothetical protein